MPTDRLKSAFAILKDAAGQFSDDRSATTAAALAFYASFSLAPLLVVVIAAAGAFFGVEAVQGRLYREIADLIGPDGAAIIQTMVANASRAEGGGITALVSLLATLVGASATFAQLHWALNRVWMQPKPPSGRGFIGGVLNLVRVRLMSMGMVLGIAFLLLLLLIVDTVMGFVVDWVFGDRDSAYWFIKAVQWITAWALMSLAFGGLMHLLTDARPPWHDTLIGGACGALLFSAGKRLFGMYLAHAGTANAFGAAGSLAVVLMWLYYSSAVFLFGAQISAARTRARERRQSAAG